MKKRNISENSPYTQQFTNPYALNQSLDTFLLKRQREKSSSPPPGGKLAPLQQSESQPIIKRRPTD